MLADVEEISFTSSTAKTWFVTRVVARIVNAYEAWERSRNKTKSGAGAERKRPARTGTKMVR
ncbi:hypothetical protein [Escherichia coli]|uniref:hypothetical protein n=1 Tax=Escherichia coli TaxID=562 RepID=UPI003D9E7624